jgi:uncharacterized glyoxalase superfamily protein PhnB
MATQWQPAGTRTVTPYLVVERAGELIAFMEAVFGAEVTERIARPDGGVTHAELRIGDSVVMLADTTPEAPVKTAMLYVYVPDADGAFARALERGARVVRELQNQHYGDRNGGFADSHGNEWWVATHVRDVDRGEN